MPGYIPPWQREPSRRPATRRAPRPVRERRSPSTPLRSPAAPSGSGQPQAPTDTSWSGTNARWYDSAVGEEGTYYQDRLIFPGVLKLLALKPGEQLLDLACGQGAFSRLAAQTGAKITGVDLSQDLIRAAKERSRGSPLNFLVADARDLSKTLEGKSFDAISCILAVQNIDPLEPVFAGAAAILKPHGRLVLVMSHPSFRIPRQSEWGWDDAKKLAYRRVDRYFEPLKIPIQTHPGANPGLTTWTFHRPLQAYITALAQAGFAIDALEEWVSERTSQPGPRAKAENRARADFPLFLALRALLCAGTREFIALPPPSALTQ